MGSNKRMCLNHARHISFHSFLPSIQGDIPFTWCQPFEWRWCKRQDSARPIFIYIFLFSESLDGVTRTNENTRPEKPPMVCMFVYGGRYEVMFLMWFDLVHNWLTGNMTTFAFSWPPNKNSRPLVLGLWFYMAWILELIHPRIFDLLS